jgi:hypothetical protein
MSRGEVLAFAGALGGAVAGWALGDKLGAGAGGALVGLVAGIAVANVVDAKFLPEPTAPPPALGGYDPFATAAAWYYIDSWVWFIGGWTPHASEGPTWQTDYGATMIEDSQAFDAHQKGSKYMIVRRFRWSGSAWVKEALQGDWSKKWSWA